jgi:hypothetical protein
LIIFRKSKLQVYKGLIKLEYAHKFYNDSSLWYVIAAANGLGKGSYYVPAGSKLRIPDALTIQQTIEQINASR